MCTRNWVHKQKEVVSKLHVCTNDIVKFTFHIYLTVYKNSNFHTLGII